MEAKKNPKQDLQRQSIKFFLIGLSISVALAITAFEWRTKKSEPVSPTFDPVLEAVLEVKPTVHEFIPPAPIPVKENISTSKSVVLVATTETKDSSKDIDIAAPPDINADFIDFPALDEPTTEIFIIVEVMPIPTGGYESFYKELSKTIKYPRQAQRNNTEGKVFVEFVVDQDGKITNLKVSKGIGDGCDEEAMRVLIQTRWQPGKQRGKPVNVRMTLPLTFKLD
jgi:periplasmic protein TonB